MSAVIDIVPRLVARKRRECEHHNCAVSMDTAELHCVDCESAIDPWWYLRALANEEREIRDDFERQAAQQRAFMETERAKYNAWAQEANERAARLKAEVDRLVELKNQLFNERVGDEPLGQIAARLRTQKLRRRR